MPLRSSTIGACPFGRDLRSHAGVHGACPKKQQRHLTGIDGAVRAQNGGMYVTLPGMSSAVRVVPSSAFEKHEPAPGEAW